MCKRFFCILFAAVLCFLTAVPAFNANAALYDKPDLELSSEHALVINLNTGVEVFGVKPDETVFPASITKVLTAILVIENCTDLEEEVEVTHSALSRVDTINHSNAGLIAGEQLTVRKLLELLMVCSACDAATVLAERVSGSEEAFAELMNAKADELGCTGTHFVNSSGVHDANHYTTARDMGAIALYALKNPAFVEFFDMKQTKRPAYGNRPEKTFSTTNLLLIGSDPNYYKYATGGKTGTTTPAGRCLVSTAKKGEDEYLCLVFGAAAEKGVNQAFPDTRKIYKWCFDNLSVVKVGTTEGAQFETKLRYAWNHDYVTLSVEEDVYAVMPNGADTTVNHDNEDGTATGLLVSVDIPDHLDAPVAKGDPAGTAKFFYRDEDGVVELATGAVVVYESVDRNFFSFIFTNIGAFFSSTPVLIIFFVLLAALIGFIVFMIIRHSRSNRHRTTFRRRRSAKTNYRRSFRR